MASAMAFPCIMAMPRCIRSPEMLSKVCLPSTSFSSRCRNARVVVPSRIDPIADQFGPCKAAYGPNYDQSIFEVWITEAALLLHPMNSQHGCQWIGVRPQLLLCFG